MRTLVMSLLLTRALSIMWLHVRTSCASLALLLTPAMPHGQAHSVEPTSCSQTCRAIWRWREDEICDLHPHEGQQPALRAVNWCNGSPPPPRCVAQQTVTPTAHTSARLQPQAVINRGRMFSQEISGCRCGKQRETPGWEAQLAQHSSVLGSLGQPLGETAPNKILFRLDCQWCHGMQHHLSPRTFTTSTCSCFLQAIDRALILCLSAVSPSRDQAAESKVACSRTHTHTHTRMHTCTRTRTCNH